MENKDKINKEKINDIIRNKLILSGIITFILLLVLILYVIPGFGEVSALTNTLNQEVSKYKNYEKNGLSYAEYLELSKNEQVKKILKENKSFYDENLVNKTNDNYLKFLSSKEELLNSQLKDGLIAQRDESMSKILPSYSDGTSVEGSITDLYFINYIERLLNTFSLSTTSKIGIDGVIPIDKNIKDIGTQIFYIPLKLDLVGRKADIVRFLYFLQTVGNSTLDDKNGLIIERDSLLNSIVLKGDTKTTKYNILENNMVDIDDITIPEYIDTTSGIRGVGESSVKGFLNYITNGTEKDNKFEVSLLLRFYVRGLPTYKIELDIEKIIKKYNDVSKDIKDILAKLNSPTFKSQTINKRESISIFKGLDKYVKELEQTAKKIESGVKQKQDLTKLYKEAGDLNYSISNLEQYIKSFNEKK
ncbi:hypothetical protein H3C61_02745 [Candidatus Gracilibacteria bacterium]|nr:hypothetical protein [Candidatus Gracilibacteria bacterium]